MNEATTSEKFDLWCLVELFGHTKIAGKCTEQNIAGASMLRVDVPETAQQPSFTRFFGGNAIYSINPIDEKTCRFMADNLQVKPIETWNISEVAKKYNLLLAQKTGGSDSGENHPEDDDDNPNNRDY